jgi:UDP-N-acetylmuramate dehydrogenase
VIATDRLPDVRGRLLRDEPLGPFTWFRVGGPADAIFLPADEDDLADFLKALDPSIPVTLLGVGSNTLVRDGGVDGVVVRLGKPFAAIEARARTASTPAPPPSTPSWRARRARRGSPGLSSIAACQAPSAGPW